MIQLTENQAAILELLRQGKTSSQIAQELDKCKGFVTNTISRLSELSAIERVSMHKYNVIISEYQVLPKAQINRHRKEKPKMQIPEDIKFYIVEHLKQNIPRSELARRLGIPKPTLLNILARMA